MANEEEKHRLFRKEFRKYSLIPFVVGISIYGLLWYLDYSIGYKSELIFFTVANIEIISVIIVPMIIIDRYFRKKHIVKSAM